MLGGCFVDNNQDFALDEIVINARSIAPQPSEDCAEHNAYSSDKSNPSSFVQKRRRMLTPEKRKELEEAYQTVIVHDYGDEYHMSEEERKRRFKYYELFSKLLRCKRKYRKLDEFVRVYRLCLDCIDVVAEDNNVYDVEKFKLLVMKGDIEVYGLNFPKYIGKDRKMINWEYIADFIMDKSRDPSELVRNVTEDEDDENNISTDQLFSKSEWENICSTINESCEEKIIKPHEDIDGAPSVSKKKYSKQLIDIAPYILTTIKDLKKAERMRIKNNGILNTVVYEMTSDDFDAIALLDQERGYVSESDIPKFHGDIMNHEDYAKFMYQLKEFEDNQIKENYQGKMRTRSEINQIKLKDTLEAAGWNVRKLYRQNDKIRNMKKRMKKDKKREEELKQKLIDIQNRQKNRSNGKTKGKKDVLEFNAKSKKKKSKKKKDDG